MYNKIADCKTTVPPIKQDVQSSHQGDLPYSYANSDYISQVHFSTNVSIARKIETPVISLTGFHIVYTVLHTHIELVCGIQFDINILILTVRRSLIRKKKKLKTVKQISD